MPMLWPHFQLHGWVTKNFLPLSTFGFPGACLCRFSTWIQASGSGLGLGAGSSLNVSAAVVMIGRDSWLEDSGSGESWESADSGGDSLTGDEAEEQNQHNMKTLKNRPENFRYDSGSENWPEFVELSICRGTNSGQLMSWEKSVRGEPTRGTGMGQRSGSVLQRILSSCSSTSELLFRAWIRGEKTL